MEKPIPSLSLAHPKSAAERFMTEMLMMSKWDHLFRVVGVEYPLMPKDFHFIPQEVLLAEAKQVDDDDMLVFFLTEPSEKSHSTIIVGMKKKEHGSVATWHPNSLFVDIYIRSKRIRSTWGAERCVIPVKRITL